MVFSSPTFVCLFLPLTLALYFLLPRSSNNLVLVGASIVFYGWGDPVAAFALILPSIVMNFYLGRMLGRAEGAGRRRLIVFSIAINLGILIVFKYSRFIVENLNDVLILFGAPTLRVPALTLPLGISFFTFHILSYLIDVYRGTTAPQSSLTAFALYIINFPQLIAGPIIRYRQIADQLAVRATTLGDFEYGVLRFVTGLAKKLLIADPIGQIADAVFGTAPSELTTGAAWLGVSLLRAADLFRFLRLFRHGDRARANVRFPLSRKLQLSLRGHVDTGLLAALAHDAVGVVSRLRLHPARREPVWLMEHRPESVDRLFPHRRVARRELEFRHLGALAWTVPVARTDRAGRSSARADAACRCAQVTCCSSC